MRISDWSSDVCSSDLPSSLASRTKPIALPPARSAAAAAWDLHERGEPVAPLPKPDSFSPRRSSVRLLEALGQLLDVLGRPVRNLHAQVQANGREHFLDLVKGLAAAVRGAQHLALGLLHQVADVDDVVVLQAVRRTDGRTEEHTSELQLLMR